MVDFKCQNMSQKMDSMPRKTMHLANPSGFDFIPIPYFLILVFLNFNMFKLSFEWFGGFEISGRDYEAESERQKGVEEFYRLQHINQTYDFVSKALCSIVGDLSRRKRVADENSFY